jgi:hypothetical protein
LPHASTTGLQVVLLWARRLAALRQALLAFLGLIGRPRRVFVTLAEVVVDVAGKLDRGGKRKKDRLDGLGWAASEDEDDGEEKEVPGGLVSKSQRP